MRPLELELPRVPLGRWIEDGIDWINDNLDGLLGFIDSTGTDMYEWLVDLLLAPPSLVMVALFTLLTLLVRSWKMAVGVLLSFLLVVSIGQWANMMHTLALVLLATITAVVIAIPLGVWCAKSDTVSAMVRPLLDLMQTLPAFVYLIPAITFFSIGVVPGLFSTVIFALPPGVRMTELGIRQVDSETVEAGQSFGATEWEILRGIQLPLAVPTIMAGVNQVIMLALSMAVISGMVGAEGLGKVVVEALATIDIAKGAEAGLSIVFLAIFLDRVTSAFGTAREKSVWRRFLPKRGTN